MITRPFADTARLYREHGWLGTLPVVGKDLNIPRNFTGNKGQYPTDADISTWISFRGGDNIVLRLPDNVLGIDIDAYDGRSGLQTIADFEDRYGQLPLTWKSSARIDGSGILFYQVPEGISWVSDLGTHSDVQIIRYAHRYAVVWPSIHPLLKRQYNWYKDQAQDKPTSELPQPTDLAHLPALWVGALTKKSKNYASTPKQTIIESLDDDIDNVDDSKHLDPRQILLGVQPGEQDEALFRYLSSLWARNMTSEEMITLGLIVIQGFENSRPNDPWTPEHVINKVHRITQTYPTGNTYQQTISEKQRSWAQGVSTGPSGRPPERVETRQVQTPRGTYTEPQNSTHALSAGVTGRLSTTVQAQPDHDQNLPLTGTQINGHGDISDEIDKIPPINSITYLDPPDSTIDTDSGNAACFVNLYGDLVRFAADTNSWYIWDGIRWKKDRLNQALSMTKGVIVKIREQALSSADRERQVLLDWAKQTESIGKRRAILAAAEAEQRIAVLVDDFDTNPYLLVVKNGTLNLITKTLYQSRPEDMCSQQCNVIFDPDAKCPMWEEHIKFVTHGDEKLARYMQAAVGYSMTGLGATHERAFFFLEGDGSNGKNAFIEPIIEVLGTYAKVSNGSLLTGDENSHPTVLANLHGARLVFVDEPKAGRQLNTERIKSLVGTRRISARYTSRDFFEYEGRFKLWITGNGRPKFGDTSDGIWSRLHEIQTLGKVGRDVKPIKDYGSILFNAEAAGILNWMLEGFSIWQKEGLNKPSSVIAAVEEHRRDEDTLSQFMSEVLDVTGKDTDRVSSDGIFATWIMWCANSNVPRHLIGTKIGFNRLFASRLRIIFGVSDEINITKPYRDPVLGKVVRGYVGVKLIDSIH